MAGKGNYEATHPVISIRVSQEIYDRLQELRRDGQSYGDILRIGLGIQEAETKPLIEAIEERELEVLKLEEKLEKLSGHQSQY